MDDNAAGMDQPVPLARRLTSECLDEILGAWRVTPEGTHAIQSGWNSSKWQIEANGNSFVLKAVALRDRRPFVEGLKIAAELEELGATTGAAHPTADGEMVVEWHGWVIALLAYVPGRHPSWTDEGEMRRVGVTLGHVHGLLSRLDPDRTQVPAWPWNWVWPRDAAAELVPWLIEPLGNLLAELHELGGREWAAAQLLHGDPGPDSFLFDGDSWGVVDWGAVVQAPRLYDLASACVLASEGSDPGAHLPTGWIVDGYRTATSISDDELAHLDQFMSLRYMVHAQYAAGRLTRPPRPDEPATHEYWALIQAAKRQILES